MSPKQAPRLTLEIRAIQRAVCLHFGYDISTMRAKDRSEPIATRRQIAMALSRTLTRAPLTHIARMFDRRDHTTITYALTAVDDKIATDPRLFNDFKTITASAVSALANLPNES